MPSSIDSVQVWQKRQEIILAYHAQGMRVKEILSAVKDSLWFVTLHTENGIRDAIYKILRSNGQGRRPSEVKALNKRAPLGATEHQENRTALENLPFPRLSTLKDMEEFQRWIKSILRPAWASLENAAGRTPDLEEQLQMAQQRIKELEYHHCPDVDEELRTENERLKEQNLFFTRRIEALSSLTAHRNITQEHVVINGK